MKKTKAAVRYGMEVLKLSPDDLFKLLESSQGYEGDNYQRWLASKIIEIAEEDGVQFSQLLVKKFNIVNEILEEVTGNQEISSKYLDLFVDTLGRGTFPTYDGVVGEDGIIPVGFEHAESLGEKLDVDWYTGIDYDLDNSFFVCEKIPEKLRPHILNNDKLSYLIRLSLEPANKKTDLYADAKGQGLDLQSQGAMMLYRLCSMSNALDLTNSKYGILCPVKFLYSPENVGILEYMLGLFKISEGYAIKSIELSENALNAGDMAFFTLELLTDEDECQDGITLKSITMVNDDGDIEVIETKRYSKSYQPMLNKISDESVALSDSVMMESNGEVTTIGKGYSEALGYLNVNGKLTLTTLPEEGKQNIAITKDNIRDIIVYYGVTIAREKEWGYSSDIQCVIDGAVGYEELLYNCLPLFLFNYSSDFADRGLVNDKTGNKVRLRNNLDAIDSEVVEKLLDTGMAYFSFEAKELYNICKDFIEFDRKEHPERSHLSFSQLRGFEKPVFDEMYENALFNLKDYVNTLSKKFF